MAGKRYKRGRAPVSGGGGLAEAYQEERGGRPGAAADTRSDNRVRGRGPTRTPIRPTPQRYSTPSVPAGTGSAAAAHQEAVADKPTKAEKRYQRKKRRYKRTMKAIKQLERATKEAETKRERQELREERDRLSDKAVKPDKSAVKAERGVEAGQKMFAKAQKELRSDKPFGIDLAKVAKRSAPGWGTEKIRAKVASEAAAPKVVKAIRATNAKNERAVLAKLAGEDGSTARGTWGGKVSKAEVSLALQGKLREVRQREGFLERRKQSRKTVGPAFRDYAEVVRTEEVRDEIRERRKALGGRKLRPRERRQEVREATADYGPAGRRLDESKHYFKHLGVVPEQGKKFFKVASDAAKHAPGRKTRRVAKRALANRGELKRDLGRGSLTVDKKGRAAAFTPKKVQQLTKQQMRRQAERKQERYDEEHSVGGVLSNTWEDVKAAADPAQLSQLGAMGWELASGGVSDMGRVFGIHRMESGSDYPRTREFIEGFKKTDPVYGFGQALLAGKSPGEALKIASERSVKHPLALGADVAVGAGGLSRGIMVGRYGRAGARHVETARPHVRIEDRAGQEAFSKLSLRERLKQTNRKRRQVRREAQARAKLQKQGVEAPASRPPAAGEQRQFYSRAGAVSGTQKLVETTRAIRGKDPFIVTGKRRGGRFFERGAEHVVRRHRPSNNALGAQLATTGGEALREVKRAGRWEPKALKQAAFELLFTGEVRIGDEAADLDKLAASYGAHSGDGTGISEYNAQVIGELRSQLDGEGFKAITDPRIQAAARKAQEAGIELVDDALVRSGYISEAVAAKRRAVYGPASRGEAVYKRKGEKLRVDERPLAAVERKRMKAEAQVVQRKREEAGMEAPRVTRPSPELARVQAALADVDQKITRALDYERSVAPEDRTPLPKGISRASEAKLLATRHPALSAIQAAIDKRRRAASELADAKLRRDQLRAEGRMADAEAEIRRERERLANREGVEGTRKRKAQPVRDSKGRIIPVEDLKTRRRQLEQKFDKLKNERVVTGHTDLERRRAKARREGAEKRAERARAERDELVAAGEGPRARALRALTEERDRIEAQVVAARENFDRDVEDRLGNPDEPAGRRLTDKRVAFGDGELELTLGEDLPSSGESLTDALRRLADVNRRLGAERKRLFDDARGGAPVAKENGWVWVDGEKVGELVTGDDPQGAYLDPDAANKHRRSKAAPDFSPTVSGQLTTTEGIHGGKLGTRFRASLEQQARVLGLVRIKAALIELSPFKRAMDQPEADVLLRRLNKKGEVQYVAVPAGRAGPLDPDNGPGMDLDLTRPARRGEKVFVVPEVILDVWKQTTKPPGKVLGPFAWTTQRFVSATLPFSIQWHAGNAIDLTTRLLIAGIDPLDPRNARLAEALRRQMMANNPDLGRETFENLHGHMGSLSNQYGGPALARALSGYEARWIVNMREAAADFDRIPGLSQAGFNIATRAEGPFVRAAMGATARRMGEDLGIVLRDHHALAERMAREFETHPELIEEFGRRTVEIIGDYSSSAFGRSWLQAIDPYWRWVRESVKLVGYTLPVKHPVKLALGLQASQLSWEAAERLGLTEYMEGTLADLAGFLSGALPMDDMPGWFRPTSPFTSFGEVAKMVEDPWTYGLGRLVPYGQKIAQQAAGERFYDAALPMLATRLGFSPPGMKPSPYEHSEYEGDPGLGMLSTVMGQFVPGAQMVQRFREGGFPSDTSNLFQPSTDDPVPLGENQVLNPFGRVRDPRFDWDAEPGRPLRRFPGRGRGRPMPEIETKGKDADSDQPGVRSYYRADGTRMRWDPKTKRFLPAGEGSDVRRGKGKGTDAPKRSKRERDAAVEKLLRKFPELGTSDGKVAVNAIARASREYDVPPEILAAIYGIESAYGSNEGPSSAGAVGDMQFMPATWEAYGVDADGDGKANPSSVVDAVHSAANYLRASGAAEEGGLYGAIFAYNHSDTYVQEVLDDAAGYRAKEWRDAGTGASIMGTSRKLKGAYAGSRRKVMQLLPPEARADARTDKRTPEENDYWGGASDSDHLTTNELAYAGDIPPDAEVYAKLRKRLGLAPAATGSDEVNLDGYRVQLIFGAEYGHGDHIHLGVRWVGDSLPEGTYAGAPSGVATGPGPLPSGVATTSGGGAPAQISMGGEQLELMTPAAAEMRRKMRRFNQQKAIGWALRMLRDDDYSALDYVSDLERLRPYVG